MNNYLELGQIVNTKGLKGEVKLNSFAEDIKVFDKLSRFFIKDKNQYIEKKIDKVGYNKNQVIMKINQCNSIEDAEKFRNKYIYVLKSDLGELPEGVYYIADLIGLDVYTDNNVLLGKVDDIYSTGANNIYVVKNELGMQKLLPEIDDVIKNINIDEGKIIVHLIEGL